MIRMFFLGLMLSATPAIADDDWVIGFLTQVSACWSPGVMSTEAYNTSIVMAFEMRPDKHPIASSLRLSSFDGGTAEHATEVFDRARRAILRCSGFGYDLPEDQYELWQSIEITFDPRQMRR